MIEYEKARELIKQAFAEGGEAEREATIAALMYLQETVPNARYTIEEFIVLIRGKSDE